VVQGCFGGRIEQVGAHEARVEETDIGGVSIVLDTAYRTATPSAAATAVLNAARLVVPVEIATGPLTFERLARLDDLRDALRRNGAIGSRNGVLLGFGLHLNTEVPDTTTRAIVPVLRAFALLEDWLRRADPIDPSRRLLPFVDPYPRSFVDLLVEEAPDWTMAQMIEAYLANAPSRNHGMDLLPLLRHIDEARVLHHLRGAQAVKARPTWHYRLPDCRIDEEEWTLAYEWNRFRVVECVAADPALLERLADDWLVHRESYLTARADWARHVGAVLDDAFRGEPTP
jgi:hypothetical protein